MELLVYLASMTLVLLALSYVMMNVYNVYASMTSAARADRAAGTLMQVLSTELRTGATIDQANSLFGVAAGQLVITAYDGVTETDKIFRIENDRVVLEVDGVDTFMTPGDMQASKLLFTQIVTPVSYAVRYEIDITYPVQGELVTKTYSGLVVMRRSYE